jgi:hypothetical protein
LTKARWAGLELFTARRAFDVLKVDAPNFGWRDDLPTLRADGIERCLHLREIDLPGQSLPDAWVTSML